jgi:hypothetical protein
MEIQRGRESYARGEEKIAQHERNEMNERKEREGGRDGEERKRNKVNRREKWRGE